MVPYISFRDLKKQISSQNPKWLDFGFTEKRQFTAKTDQNSIFLGHKAQSMN
jgi:hypothetical protein